MTTLAQQWLSEGMEKGLEKGMQQGIQQGMEKSAHRIAKNLLAQGLSPANIAQVTDLPISVILALQAEMQGVS